MRARWIYTLVLASICHKSHAHVARIMHSEVQGFNKIEYTDSHPEDQEASIVEKTIVDNLSTSTITDDTKIDLVPATADGVLSETSKDTTNPKPIPSDLPKLPTYKQFCAAVDAYSLTRAGGHPEKPSKELYYQYQDIVARNMSIGEQAMLLSNIIWETGGFQYMEEIACRDGSCEYGDYYGRGYIQLTWKSNYMDASYAIYGDDRLVRHPDLVAKPKDAWKTTIWYWNVNVAPMLRSHNAVPTFKLGYSVMAINGNQECNKQHSNALERLRIYNAILVEWELANGPVGKLTGCMKTWDLDIKNHIPMSIINDNGVSSDAIVQKEHADTEDALLTSSQPREPKDVLSAQEKNADEQRQQVKETTPSSVAHKEVSTLTTAQTNTMEEGLFKTANDTRLSYF